jgi:polar amino acid transport system substrate-binding protein
MPLRRAMAILSTLLGGVAGALPAAEAPVLRWGGDAEGGFPLVEADPGDPSRVQGMDVDVAAEIAHRLGRKPRFVQVTFSSIDASVARGDFDIGLSGVEDTPARRRQLAATAPYFEFREVLTVRGADRPRYPTLGALAGRRVGTLGATIAYEILLEARDRTGLIPVSYDDDVHPYADLARGRLDAVLLDHILAERSVRRVPGLAIQPEPVATGHYVAVLARANGPLRDRVNGALREMMRDGTLERVFRKWGVWDDSQRRLFERSISGEEIPPFSVAGAGGGTADARFDAYLPALFRAAGVTLLLSCLAMALAVAAGIAIAAGRVYGKPLLQAPLTAYVEVVRGTPVLLQLFVLYYGLSAAIRLPAFVAAMIGLGLNYAAYESEIYRGAMQAVPRSQLEAARTLGLSEGMIFRLVRGPQALRFALAPMTNDFVALLKDSSLVSVITVVELTKQTTIFAANIGSWAVPGALCALLYLALSLPLARLARRLERRWSAPR